MEPYEHSSEDQLWQLLGRGFEKTMPLFNTMQFVTGALNPWTQEGAAQMDWGSWGCLRWPPCCTNCLASMRCCSTPSRVT